ncbi:MAG TPA: type I secretion C-terminal target domain-containing protein [Candidatus Obscuribacterales bacterium]
MSNITNSSSDILVILDELINTGSPTTTINSPDANFHGISSSSNSTTIINHIGAGGASQATTISPTGEVQNSSESVFIPSATSSEATATAISGTDILPTTETTVIIEPENHNPPPPTPMINADVFVLNTNPNFPNTDPNLADTITDFNAAEGDKIGLSENLIGQLLILETFDSNADGSLDATVIKLRSDSQSEVLGVVLGTVSTNGQTTLTPTDFTIISNNLLMLR